MQNSEEYLRLINTGHERRDVDYKRDMPWDNSTKFGIIKDVLAFANAGGGNLVIGVAEEDAALLSYTGVSDSNLKTWEVTKVCQGVNKFSDPEIDLEVIKVSGTDEGKCYILVRIPSHGTTPHVCKQDKHDESGKLHLLRKCAIYHRSKNKSCEEISSAEDLRALIRRCCLNDRAELIKVFEHVLTGRTGIGVSIPEQDIDPIQLMNEFSKEAVPYHPSEPENGRSDDQR
ncbi:MAG: ATP-binding protein [candidate division Zixibacteria bacterium]|nr:ATP-binding protein [candidate division Zixibacteria bacterium]